MILAISLLEGVGSVAGSAALLLGAYATVQARRTEKASAAATAHLAERSADREETEQALKAQSQLLDRYEKRIAALEERNTKLHDSINEVVGKLGVVTEEERKCQHRLAIAEARIAELGG